MKIILIRHAEVDISKNAFVYASEIPKWIDIYNNAEIKKHFVSKSEISNIFNSSNKIFCSGLKRSVDSVKLYGKNPNEQDEVFNEAGLPYANWRWVKLPLSVWATVFRVMWIFGYKNNGESLQEAKVRAKKGADKLIEYCEKGNTVTLLGHGLMNRLIGKELLQRGWTTPHKMGISNWAYGVFELVEESH
jgi:broad specificity phosphatase PhoE